MQLAARVALLAALVIASVCARQRCHTDSYGRLKGLHVSLAELPIPHQHTSIEIPNVCPRGQQYIGMKISVCDSNGSPVVTAASLYEAEVHLKGLPGRAVAYITEYCDRGLTGSQVGDVNDEQSENSSPIAYELDSDE